MMTDLVSQWETECVDSCCIIMNIRLSETRNTFVANSRITGNHLVCIYYTSLCPMYGFMLTLLVIHPQINYTKV